MASSSLQHLDTSWPEHSASQRSPQTSGKLALMFLSYGEPPNAPAWEAWLSDADPSQFSICLHAKHTSEVKHPLFKNSLVHAVETQWGDVSLVAAHRTLVTQALKDPKNTHFMLLSGVCLPFKSFDTVYQEVMVGLEGLSAFDVHPEKTKLEQLENIRSMNKNEGNGSNSQHLIQEIIGGMYLACHSQWCLLNRHDATRFSQMPDVWLNAFREMLPVQSVKNGETLAADEMMILTFLMHHSRTVEGVDYLFVNRVVTFSHCCMEFGSGCRCSKRRAAHPLVFRSISTDKFPKLVTHAISKDSLFVRKFEEGINCLHLRTLWAAADGSSKEMIEVAELLQHLSEPENLTPRERQMWESKLKKSQYRSLKCFRAHYLKPKKAVSGSVAYAAVQGGDNEQSDRNQGEVHTEPDMQPVIVSEKRQRAPSEKLLQRISAARTPKSKGEQSVRVGVKEEHQPGVKRKDESDLARSLLMLASTATTDSSRSQKSGASKSGCMLPLPPANETDSFTSQLTPISGDRKGGKRQQGDTFCPSAQKRARAPAGEMFTTIIPPSVPLFVSPYPLMIQNSGGLHNLMDTNWLGTPEDKHFYEKNRLKRTILERRIQAQPRSLVVFTMKDKAGRPATIQCSAGARFCAHKRRDMCVFHNAGQRCSGYVLGEERERSFILAGEVLPDHVRRCEGRRVQGSPFCHSHFTLYEIAGAGFHEPHFVVEYLIAYQCVNLRSFTPQDGTPYSINQASLEQAAQIMSKQPRPQSQPTWRVGIKPAAGKTQQSHPKTQSTAKVGVKPANRNKDLVPAKEDREPASEEQPSELEEIGGVKSEESEVEIFEIEAWSPPPGASAPEGQLEQPQPAEPSVEKPSVEKLSMLRMLLCNSAY